MHIRISFLSVRPFRGHMYDAGQSRLSTFDMFDIEHKRLIKLLYWTKLLLRGPPALAKRAIPDPLCC